MEVIPSIGSIPAISFCCARIRIGCTISGPAACATIVGSQPVLTLVTGSGHLCDRGHHIVHRCLLLTIRQRRSSGCEEIRSTDRRGVVGRAVYAGSPERICALWSLHGLARKNQERNPRMMEAPGESSGGYVPVAEVSTLRSHGNRLHAIVQGRAVSVINHRDRLYCIDAVMHCCCPCCVPPP